jgi:hypothetical protein
MSEPSSSDPHAYDRRDFLRLGAAAGAGLVAGGLAVPVGAALPPLPVNRATFRAMPTRNLGLTGFRPGIFSLGGQAAIEQPDNEAVAVAIVERALDLGVNYIDTAAAYGGTERWSQRYIGRVMKRRRRETFLTSKTNDRTRDGSLALLEESLRLLNTDHLDLWQVHNLSRMDQVDEIFAPGGAMDALRKAREEKMVRFLGVTGHADPEVLMEAMRRFEFDTVLLALNAADPHHLSFSERLLPMAVEKRMGVIGMKIPARGRLLASWTPPPVDQQRDRAPRDAGRAQHARSARLRADAPGEHGDRGLRLGGPARGERGARARLHPAQRPPDGRAHRPRRAGREAGAVLPALGIGRSLPLTAAAR